jgi:hypothetical protein
MKNMETKLGTDLNFQERRYVLNKWVYRFTGENKPEWANQLKPDGTSYAVQFLDDKDWLANTRFYVTTTGKLSNAIECESNPTWPFNPELRIK